MTPEPIGPTSRPRSEPGADYHEWLFHPNARDETASIIKVDILETLLRQSRGALSYDARVTAEGMIDDSDNDDATDLWNADGGGSAGCGLQRIAGLTQTSPNLAGYWGLTLTSAADQIKLLTELAYPSRVLTTGSRRYALNLMEHVTPDQDWGVSGGVPRNVTVALKNGWLPTGGYELADQQHRVGARRPPRLPDCRPDGCTIPARSTGSTRSSTSRHWCSPTSGLAGREQERWRGPLALLRDWRAAPASAYRRSLTCSSRLTTLVRRLETSNKTGGDLLSQALSSQVPSAQRGLTALFGKGRGVSPSL